MVAEKQSSKSTALTHVDAAGQARMVDVSAKQPTKRVAVAEGFVRCQPQTVAMLRDDAIPKGDVLAVARIAGIAAAKKTPDLLPLAHVIGVHGARIDVNVTDEGVSLSAEVTSVDVTGVEMEALTAVSVAALAVVDMLKGVDRGIIMENLRITQKHGGRSGSWTREDNSY